MGLSILLSVLGLVVICWLVFNLIVYALPFGIGLALGLYLNDVGHGVILSMAAGLLSGTFALVAGQIAFATARSLAIRVVIGLVYAVPAGIAGFHAVQGFAGMGGADEIGGLVLSALGAVVVGGIALARIAGLPDQAERDPSPSGSRTVTHHG